MLQLYYGHTGRMADTLRQILLDCATTGGRVSVLHGGCGGGAFPSDPPADAASCAEPLARALEGPAVHQLQSAFAAAWVEATGVLVTVRANLAAYDDGVESAGLLYTSPTLGSTPAERFYALSIAAARKTLYIT